MLKAKSLRAVAASAMTLMLVAPSISPAWAESAQDKRERKEAEIPTCPKRLGTIAIVEPETNWWTQYGLGSPEALLKVFVMKSGCFTLVDLANFVRFAGTIKNTLSRGSFTGVDMSDNANISSVFERVFAGHGGE